MVQVHLSSPKLPYKNTGALFFTNSDCLSIKNGKIITQIPVGIILYEIKKGLNKRFFQKKHEKHLIFLSEYGIIRLYFIR